MEEIEWSSQGVAESETSARTWAVIVAGSAGALGRALEQAESVSPPERTFVVVTARRPGGLKICPPAARMCWSSRSIAAAPASILFPLHWIHARDPEATVVVFGDDPPRIARGFGHQIAEATRHAESLILLGLSQGVGEPERGFILPGERIESTVEGPLFRVRDLAEPDPEGDARPRPARCAMAPSSPGRAKVFIEAAAEHGAALNDRLARAATFAGQEHERWALRQAYALAPRVDFFRSVLRPIARALAVLEIEDAGRLADGDEERARGGRASLGLGAWSTVAAPG